MHFSILIYDSLSANWRGKYFTYYSSIGKHDEEKKKKIKRKKYSRVHTCSFIKANVWAYDWFLFVSGYQSWCVSETLTIPDLVLYCWLLNFVFGIYIRRLVQMTCSSSVLSFYSRLPTNLSYPSSSTVPTSISKFFLGPLHTAIISLTGNWIIYAYPVVWSRPTATYKSRLIFGNIDKWMIKGRQHKKKHNLIIEQYYLLKI